MWTARSPKSPVADPRDEDDGALARRAAGGEARAFDALMARHKAPLHRFALRYLGDEQAALEIVQEAFVAAWANLARYDAERPFTPWLRRIALNKCRDWSRRRAVRRLVFGDRDLEAPEARTRPDPAPGAEAELIRTQRLAALRRAIDGLPLRLREPLVLTALEGMSQQEAAEVLGVTVKAVETRVHRARRKLAQTLGLDEATD